MEKMFFGIEVREKGLKKGIEDFKKNKFKVDRESLKKFKESYGKDYKVHIKRETAEGLLELASWTMALRDFRDKRAEVIEETENLIKEVLDILEELKENE